MIIVFDTETSGLPKNWGAPVTDGDAWPRMVQLAWQLYRDDGRKIAEHNYIIKPEGYEIPEEVAKIHGITTERALAEGMPLEWVLMHFHLSVIHAHTLVAHNISFDQMILGAEFARNGNWVETRFKIVEESQFLKKVCTMKGSTDFCGIQGSRGKKWPKLIELHEKLFGNGFEGAHDALVDVQALAKCYFELKKLNIL